MAERDAALGQIIGRQFQRDFITRENADVVLAHLAGGLGSQSMTVVQRNTVTGIRQYFVDGPVHFDEFFSSQ